jgi:hypothetical protein
MRGQGSAKDTKKTGNAVTKGAKTVGKGTENGAKKTKDAVTK